MKGWLYTTFFILTLLVVLKYTVKLLMELLSSEPNVVKLSWKEEVLVGISVAYAITYMIY
jgi:hypothetical protein